MTLKLEPLPPREAIDYLASKGLQVSFAWQDVYAEEHAINFTVAKMARLDLLQTVREHVTRAIREGRTLPRFAAELRPILEAEGWWGKQEMTDPVTGETKVVQLGSPRRLRIIYDTNLRTAYSAGRWERFQRAKDILPYLTYRTMRDGRVRAQHRAWDGITLPQTHEWWNTHYPPNGWRCRCIAYGIDKEDAERLASAGRPIRFDAPPTATLDWVNPRTGEIRQVPVGIDPGFDYNPGKGRMAQLERLLREKEAAFDRLGMPDLHRVLRQAEDEIAGGAVETTVVFSADGEEVLRKAGDAYGVPFTAAELPLLADATVTHSHTVVSSFSIEDMELFARRGIHELRAVDAKWLYILRRTQGALSPEQRQQFLDAAYQAEGAAWGVALDKLTRGQISEKEFTEMAYHWAWTRLKSLDFVAYSRKKR